MSCFDVVYQPSPPYPGYLTYQRSVSNSPLKKRCRLDPEQQQIKVTSSESPYCSLGLHFATTEGQKPDTQAFTGNVALPAAHSSSSGGSSSFHSAPLPSASTSSTTSSSTTSLFSIVALKSEMTSASNDGGDLQPVMTQHIGGNSVLLTYFSEDIDTNIDNHFHRALKLSHQNRIGFSAASAAAPENKSQSSSCCRQESSPLSHRSLPASFWNSVSASPSSYLPPNGSTWSSLMVSPKSDSLGAATFTVSPDSVDPYAHHLNFSSAAAGAASPTGGLGPLHHSQDPWHPYAFCPPPPPPPPPSTYRRYRHSIHEFSISADTPCSGGHFASGMRGYKTFLHGHGAGRADTKPHADVWRSRCRFSDMTGPHIAAGFTLTGGIEVTQTNLPDASVKDVYWF